MVRVLCVFACGMCRITHKHAAGRAWYKKLPEYCITNDVYRSRTATRRNLVLMSTSNQRRCVVFLCSLAARADIIRITKGVSSSLDRSRDLGRDALRVAREHRRLADVVQTQVEHHHTLHADAAAGVRRAAEAERLNIRCDLVDVCANRNQQLIHKHSPTNLRSMPSSHSPTP